MERERGREREDTCTFPLEKWPLTNKETDDLMSLMGLPEQVRFREEQESEEKEFDPAQSLRADPD